LVGVVGRNKGAAEGFKYGSYLKGVGGVWDEVGLRAWVADSKGVAKAAGGKSKMGSQKIVGEKADDLIAYLKTLN
jgi:cytochrome c